MQILSKLYSADAVLHAERLLGCPTVCMLKDTSLLIAQRTALLSTSEAKDHISIKTQSVVSDDRMLCRYQGCSVLCSADVDVCVVRLQVSSQWGLSRSFLGFIVLPIAGNACEHITAVFVAAKDKMDLSLGVAIGSSIQVTGDYCCFNTAGCRKSCCTAGAGSCIFPLVFCSQIAFVIQERAQQA